MNRKVLPHQTTYLFFVVITTSLLLIVHIEAAYQIGRPTTIGTYGYINQGYLYGEGSSKHKGIDFPAVLNTNVLAVADGTVRDIEENIPNNCHPPDPTCQHNLFGNYILVQHDKRQYDRTTNQMSYVYSLYAHLSQNGVLVNVNDHVSAGQHIGEVDNTGNSTGNHLHLQIMLDSNSDRVITYPLTWTESNSRNPEIWLTPYSSGNIETGTVIGKVTHIDGSPEGGLLVYGLQKQTGWGYGSSLTYIDGEDLNPDDILVENWATTDVTPGTYHITLSNGDDMGWHEVRAGEVTYVGLYPVWLPFVRQNFSGWNSIIYVRNNSASYRAQINTTYFTVRGYIQEQRTDYVNPNAALILVPPNGFSGSAIVVSSEDIAVSVLTEHNPPFASAAYVGVADPGKDFFIPLVHRNNYGWNSLISIHNTGPGAQVQVEFIPDTAGNACTQSQWVETNGTWRLYSANLGCLGSSFVGSARITSTSPLAASDIQYKTSYASLIGSSSAVVADNNLFAPLIQNNNYGWTSGFTLQNATGNWQTFWTFYYRPSGGFCRSDSYTIAPYKPEVVYPAPPAGCNGDATLSALFTGNGNMNVQVNQIISGSDEASGYPAVAMAATRAIVPFIRKDATWGTGLQIQNTSAGTASVTVTYYSSSGSYAGSQTLSIPGNGFATIYPVSPPSPFYGSAVVESTNGRNLAVIVNYLKTAAGDSGDVIMSHIAPNR